MSFLSELTARLPFNKKEGITEHFFALNIDSEKVEAGVWAIENNSLKIFGAASKDCSGEDELLPAIDFCLDHALGDSIIEPEKILFGVPDSWLSEDNLKEAYLNLLRKIVKELELQPMAYVSTSHALSHFLEKQEGAPTTAIMIGVGKNNLVITVLRAGKMDGTKVVPRREEIGLDAEKGLLSFTEIEVLPSRVLVYGEGDLEKYKNELLSFPWMQKLSFLHFPKIAVLDNNAAIKAISFAGAVELDPAVKYLPETGKIAAGSTTKSGLLREPDKKEIVVPKVKAALESDNFGFVSGDIAKQIENEEAEASLEEDVAEPRMTNIQQQEFEEQNNPLPEKEEAVTMEKASSFDLEKPMDRRSPLISLAGLPFAGKGKIVLLLIILLAILIGAYLILLKASVKVYVEPQALEKDTQVTVDPLAKSVDESAKVIPGEAVKISESGSDQAQATGQKQIGNPAKGTVKVINNSNDSQTFSQGSTITASGIKFTFDSTVNVASTSATADSKSTATGSVTATVVGADGNISSGTQFSSGNSQVAIVAEGNFSGGNSKNVTAVTDDDQKKLLASLSDSLRHKAQQELQAKYPDKKVLAEALSESISKKSYNKNVGDQASSFTLNLSADYKGTAYNDSDLRTIVSKLVETNVPDNFQLDLSQTETQADVSKVEKDGKVIFLARFKAKMMPKINSSQIKKQLRGRSVQDAVDIIKGYDNVLGSDIAFNLPLPALLLRLPLLEQNISIQVGAK